MITVEIFCPCPENEIFYPEKMDDLRYCLTDYILIPSFNSAVLSSFNQEAALQEIYIEGENSKLDQMVDFYDSYRGRHSSSVTVDFHQDNQIPANQVHIILSGFEEFHSEEMAYIRQAISETLEGPVFKMRDLQVIYPEPDPNCKPTPHMQ